MDSTRRERTTAALIELAEHSEAIEAWRNTLPERQRKRLIHPLSNVRRWRAATQPKLHNETNKIEAAMIAWQRFVSCVSTLPARPRSQPDRFAAGPLGTPYERGFRFLFGLTGCVPIAFLFGGDDDEGASGEPQRKALARLGLAMAIYAHTGRFPKS